MKILSPIEGDNTNVKESLLDNLTNAIKDGLSDIAGEENSVSSIKFTMRFSTKKRIQIPELARIAQHTRLIAPRKFITLSVKYY